MKQISLFFFSFLLVSGLMAQGKEAIQFKELKHDFGTIYKGAKADHTFEFTNVSDAPVKLKSVKASCGCTTPNWSQEPVKPKSNGSISASYDSHRVGQFTKTITVVYDTTQNPIVLTIAGTVLDTTHEGEHNHAPQAPKISYNFPQGNLSFEKQSDEIGSIDTDQKRELNYKVRNMGKNTIRFKDESVKDQPAYFSYLAKPQMLQAGQEGIVTVLLDASKYQEAGVFSSKALIATDDNLAPIKELTISGTFNKVLTAEEKAIAPNIKFDVEEYSVASAIEGEKVIYKYKFVNTGKSDLKIESAKGSCGCTVAEPKDKVIPPGQSSEITATFDSAGRPGKNMKTITVKSNDPDNEIVTLKLTVNVEKDPFHAGGSGPVEKTK